MSQAAFVLGCGLAGLAVGVFVNVLIVRAPGDRSFAPPWTRCASCPVPPSAATLLPVAGYFVMEGRCGGCGRRIGWWQPLVEVGNALLWMLAAAYFGPSLELVAVLPLFSGLLALSVIDLQTFRLPDRINLPLLLIGIVLVVAVSLAQGRPEDLVGAAIGGAGYWLLLAAMWLVYPRGMGYGDVKLARVLGWYLGWFSPALVLYGLMFAGIGGSIVGIGTMIVTRDRTRGFPFGPWMAAGCILAILGSETLTR